MSENPPPSKPADPMHGVTLQMIITRLEAYYGWQELGRRIKINCFISDPSLSSSLKFLRRTPWAREKVEKLYLQTNWSSSQTSQALQSSQTNANIWDKKTDTPSKG